VRCLRRPVHSGRGGGVLPDPIQVMCRLLARLPGAGLRIVRLDAPSVVGSINQITDLVRARLQLPALSGARGRAAALRIAARLQRRPPFGAVVRVRVVFELGGASGAPPRPPARVFRGGEVDSPPLIPRGRSAAPGGVNPASLAAVAPGSVDSKGPRE